MTRIEVSQRNQALPGDADGGARVGILTIDDIRTLARDVAREAVREAVAALQRAPMSKSQLAAALGKSTSTIDRYIAAGMPHDGDGVRKTFDLDTCREWLRARPAERANVLTDGVVRRRRAA